MTVRRRHFLRGSAALLSAAAAPALAEDGRKVFLDYTQEQLDQAYDQSVWAPQLVELQAFDTTSSAEVRQKMPPRTERFGKTEIEQLDIFAPAGAKGAPIFIYIHGGAWLFNRRTDASFFAPAVVARGAALVVPDFDNVKQVRLTDMIEQCRRAVEWTVRNAERFGGDPGRIYLGGHSSGGHLASCMLVTDWASRGLPADPIKGALLVSGMYELRPAMLSSRGKYVHITAEEEAAASAMRHLHRINCPVAVAYSLLDSPEFRRQARVLAEALAGMGRLASLTEVFGANHFQEMHHLTRPETNLSRALYALMGI